MEIMVFLIALAGILAGVVLGYPIVRSLANLVEARLHRHGRIGADASEGDRTEIEELEQRVAELEEGHRRLAEQQGFLEALLQPPDAPERLEPPDGERGGG